MTSSSSSSGDAATSTLKSGRKSEAAINEGILKVMADLKIDTSITREVSIAHSVVMIFDTVETVYWVTGYRVNPDIG